MAEVTSVLAGDSGGGVQSWVGLEIVGDDRSVATHDAAKSTSFSRSAQIARNIAFYYVQVLALRIAACPTIRLSARPAVPCLSTTRQWNAPGNPKLADQFWDQRSLTCM